MSESHEYTNDRRAIELRRQVSACYW